MPRDMLALLLDFIWMFSLLFFLGYAFVTGYAQGPNIDRRFWLQLLKRPPVIAWLVMAAMCHVVGRILDSGALPAADGAYGPPLTGAERMQAVAVVTVASLIGPAALLITHRLRRSTETTATHAFDLARQPIWALTLLASASLAATALLLALRGINVTPDLLALLLDFIGTFSVAVLFGYAFFTSYAQRSNGGRRLWRQFFKQPTVVALILMAAICRIVVRMLDNEALPAAEEAFGPLLTGGWRMQVVIIIALVSLIGPAALVVSHRRRHTPTPTIALARQPIWAMTLLTSASLAATAILLALL